MGQAPGTLKTRFRGSKRTISINAQPDGFIRIWAGIWAYGQAGKSKIMQKF